MVRSLTDFDFSKEVLEAKEAVLVVCYTPDSGLCKLILDTVEELTVKYAGTARFYKMHVYDSKDTFIEYRVMNLPTLLYFKGGALVNRLSDITVTGNLKAQVENMISGEFLMENPFILEVNDKNYFQETDNFNGIVILNFWVSGMDICWSMEKDLTELAKEYQNAVKICIVNWRESRDLSTQFRIAEIPTMIFLYRQEEYDRLIGLKGKRSIENVLRHLAFRFSIL